MSTDTPETDRIALLLENLDEWIDDSLRNSKPIGLTLCAARSTISDHRARITELWDALETLRRERDEAREHWGTESMNAAQFLSEKTKSIAERDEAREDLEFRRELYKVQEEFLEKNRKELTEAREALKHIEEYGTEEINSAVDLRQRLATALVERDEARAVAGAMADIAFKHLTSLLASTPHSKDAAHEEETQQVIAAIKKWKELKV